MSYDALEAETWIARTGRPDGPRLRHRDGVLYAAFSPDGRRAVTCGEDFRAIIWDPKTGAQTTPSLDHHGQVMFAAFNQDGRFVATLSTDSVVTVWDAVTGDRLAWLGDLELHDREKRPWLGFTQGARGSGTLGSIIIRAGWTTNYVWDLPVYRGEPGDLVEEAKLLSAHRLLSSPRAGEAGGLIPLSTKELSDAWRKRPRPNQEPGSSAR
jgi:hypothetical protein